MENLNEPLSTPVASPVPDLPVPRILRAIDWLRPDHAVFRALGMNRTPKPYEERYPHQGKRECERRIKQRDKGMI